MNTRRISSGCAGRVAEHIAGFACGLVLLAGIAQAQNTPAPPRASKAAEELSFHTPSEPSSPIRMDAAALRMMRYVGKIEIAGDSSDKSGLEGRDPSGVAKNRLGSFGSAIDFDAASGLLFAMCDRGPFDGASAFQCRAQVFSLRLARGSASASNVGTGSGAASASDATTDVAPWTTSAALERTVLLTSSAGEALVGSLDLFEPALAGPARHDGGSGLIPPRLDPEGLRVAPDGTWWVSDEYGPWIDQFSDTGTHLRRIELPERFRIVQAAPTYQMEMPPTNTRGRQANRGLESLAIAPSGRTLFTMTQSPLLQDGGVDDNNRRVGVNIRLVKIGLGESPSETPTFKEFVYELDDRRDGVNELLALNEHQLLVLERDGNPGEKAKSRKVYLVDVSEASDVSDLAALPRKGVPEDVQALRKTLVLDLLDPAHGLAGASMPEKIEGMSFGPVVEGKRTLLIATDNDLIAENPTVIWVFAER